MITFALLKGFLAKEFKQTLRDKRMRILLFIAPLIQLTLFGVAISTDVKNIRLWVKYAPNDYLLQHIYEHCLQSQWFIPASDPETEPDTLLRAGKIDAAIIPPANGLSQALNQHSANLQLLIDATNVIQAQSIENYLKKIIDRVILEDLKMAPSKPSIEFAVRVLFNPTLETCYFMVPGVMCLLLCMVTLILTSASITREKELGTFEMLISAPIAAKEIILGKTVPYIILGMGDLPLILAVAIGIFQVPMRGNFLILGLVTFIFVCTAVAIGTLISTFAKNQQQSALGGFLFLFPAILLSGLMFPLENMPEIMKWISFLDPLSHFLALLRNIMLKGGETGFVLFHTGVLALMAIFFTFISYKRFHTTLQ